MTLDQIINHFKNMYNNNLTSDDHLKYLFKLKTDYNYEPNVIYDIGSSVATWSRDAAKIWPNSKIYLFEGMVEVEPFYNEIGIENYNLGVLSDIDDKELIFYQSIISPGGNSYYRENSCFTDIYYGKESEKIVKTITVDTIVKNKNFELPSLIKIDVQGCELDILRGMQNTLKHCEHLIVELQKINYNTGAPLNTESITIIESMGFELITPLFCDNGVDGDYHFKKIKQ